MSLLKGENKTINTTPVLWEGLDPYERLLAAIITRTIIDEGLSGCDGAKLAKAIKKVGLNGILSDRDDSV